MAIKSLLKKDEVLKVLKHWKVEDYCKEELKLPDEDIAHAVTRKLFKIFIERTEDRYEQAYQARLDIFSLERDKTPTYVPTGAKYKYNRSEHQ